MTLMLEKWIISTTKRYQSLLSWIILSTSYELHGSCIDVKLAKACAFGLIASSLPETKFSIEKSNIRLATMRRRLNIPGDW
jgi:hypothetical protein